MVDTEVENVLREIHAPVRAEAHSQLSHGAEAAQPAAIRPAGQSPGARGQGVAGALAHLEECLTTTGRAWNELPPLTSKRRGVAARIDLWIKRQLRRATHWYTWEQVHFNEAVHYALRDILLILSGQEQAVPESRAASRGRGSVEEWDDELARLRAEVVELRSEQARLRSLLDERAVQFRDEQRERVEQLIEEQRVGFKQLAIEIKETAVNAERSGRTAQSRLDEIAGRIEAMHNLRSEIEELRRAISPR